MKTRIITSIAALAVFFGVLLIPKYCFPAAERIVFPAAIAAIIYIMLFECYRATKASLGIKITELLCATFVIASGVPFVTGYNFHTTAQLCALAAFLVIFINMTALVIFHGRHDYKEILSNAFLTMYVTVSAACIVICKAYFGTKYMMMIFICAWSTDTFAYFTGKFLGKHKLIPHVSPNKTVEGAVGGVVGAAVMCTLYLFAVNRIFDPNVPWLAGLAIGAVGGVFAQIGDLVASAIKRDTNVKDFGWIFPGHGGFMDRFDSVIFIAPLISGALALVLSVIG